MFLYDLRSHLSRFPAIGKDRGTHEVSPDEVLDVVSIFQVLQSRFYMRAMDAYR